MKLTSTVMALLAFFSLAIAGPVPEHLQTMTTTTNSSEPSLLTARDGRRALVCGKPRAFYSLIAAAYKTRFAYNLEIHGRGWNYAGLKEDLVKCGQPGHSRWKHWRVKRKDGSTWDWTVSGSLHMGNVDVGPDCYKNAIAAAGGPVGDGLVMGRC